MIQNDRPDSLKILNEIASEITKLKFDKTKSLKESFNDFYDVMRKYGIKRCEPSENGQVGNTPEWVLCETLFKTRIELELVFMSLMDCPEDLDCYNKIS